MTLPAILFEDTGELGNRLVTYAHLLALSLHYKVPVANLCFWRHRAHLQWRSRSIIEQPWEDEWYKENDLSPQRHLNNCDICRFPLGRCFQRRLTFGGELIIHTSLLLQRTLGFALRSLLSYSLVRKGVSLFYAIENCRVDGHLFSILIPRLFANESLVQSDRLQRWSPIVRNRLALRSVYTDLAKEQLVNCKLGPGFTRIGIHIRRGDYRVYHDGKYYFDDNLYFRVVKTLATLFGNQVQFVLASNEALDDLTEGLFPGSEFVVAPTDPLVTLAALGQCAVIIGPPSTFSGWASFAYEVPVAFIEQPNVPVQTLLAKGNVWKPRWY